MSAALDWILNNLRTYPTADGGIRVECPTSCSHFAELEPGATIRAQIRAGWHRCDRTDEALDVVMALYAAAMPKPQSAGVAS